MKRDETTHLNSEERCQNYVRKYDQVDFIEEAPGHENDKNEVHDGEDSESDALHDGVSGGEVVVDNDHGDGDGDEQAEEAGHVVLVHAEEVSLIQHFNVNILHQIGFN